MNTASSCSKEEEIAGLVPRAPPTFGKQAWQSAGGRYSAGLTHNLEIPMGQQLNKIQKRARRKRYMERLKKRRREQQLHRK